jgi:divalent metal cation (Fe/Co/Zn/Cd) transporter
VVEVVEDRGQTGEVAEGLKVRGTRAVKISLLALGATSGAQLVIVLISGSVALLADTIHNFSTR